MSSPGPLRRLASYLHRRPRLGLLLLLAPALGWLLVVYLGSLLQSPHNTAPYPRVSQLHHGLRTELPTVSSGALGWIGGASLDEYSSRPGPDSSHATRWR